MSSGLWDLTRFFFGSLVDCTCGALHWLSSNSGEPEPEDQAPSAASPVGQAAGVAVQVGSVHHPALEAPHLPVIPLEDDFIWALLTAKTQESLERLFPTFLEPLVDHPDFADLGVWDPAPRGWTIRARLVRALRAGVSARRVALGFFPKQAQSLSLPFDNKVYICVRAPAYPTGFCTTSYPDYILRVTSRSTGDFLPGVISHAFPTSVEGGVFLRGALLQWPVEVLAQQS